MATGYRNQSPPEIDYPTGDGKPMSETELHMWVTMDLIQTLAHHFAGDPMVYVGGDLLVYYAEGFPNKRLSPDVFIVRGVPKRPPRDNFLIWEEGKGPDVVIEITSKSTRREDETTKRALYRDVLKTPEYFKFDPTEDYLRPAFQGARLRDGVYVPIEPVEGRLPSEQLGLHLERAGTSLRLYDPALGRWLATPSERAEAEAARAQSEAARAQSEAARADSAEAEASRLRLEIEELRRRLANGS